MWRVSRSRPHDQLNASFESTADLEAALVRMTSIQEAHPEAYVWARSDFFDVAARRTKAGEVVFVVCPTSETDSEPPDACRPYNAAELLELVAQDEAVAPAEEECSSCGQRRRGRYANRSESGHPLFLCSTCGRWTETLPSPAKLGRRSRRSDLSR